MIDFLLNRRSTPLKLMSSENGPSRDEINTILTAAARVPDHNKVFPWHFTVLQGEQRREAGHMIGDIYATKFPDAPTEKLSQVRDTFMRAHTVIIVTSRIREAGAPIWEQALSAGAASYNLCLAANAIGYGTNWLTEWYCFDDAVKKAFGLDERDHFAGFIYIGAQTEKPEDRDRPDLNVITTFWEKDKPLNKGDDYGRKGRGYPEDGFDFSKIKRG